MHIMKLTNEKMTFQKKSESVRMSYRMRKNVKKILREKYIFGKSNMMRLD